MLERLRQKSVALRVDLKWQRDKRRLPLTSTHRELYDIIHHFYYRHRRRFPDLVDCPELNDKIQWLKLFDQDPMIVKGQDKIAVRERVIDRVGAHYLPELYQIGETPKQLDFDKLPPAFVLKTNHDCGTVFLVRDKGKADLPSLCDRLNEAIARPPYGWMQGEWGYRYIPPKVFAEELLDPCGAAPPADYKFHCAEGKVRFVHYLYGRVTRAASKEQIISPDGHSLDIRVSTYFEAGNAFVKPSNWNEMIRVAESIARGFKYVRVDLYNVDGRVYFGELTFWPGSGVYPNSREHQARLGAIVDFDRTTVRPPFSEERCRT